MWNEAGQWVETQSDFEAHLAEAKLSGRDLSSLLSYGSNLGLAAPNGGGFQPMPIITPTPMVNVIPGDGGDDIAQAAIPAAILTLLWQLIQKFGVVALGSWLAGLLTSGLVGDNGDGGGQAMVPGNGGLGFIPQGPGVPEPPAAMISKSWKIRTNAGGINEWWVFFWRLVDGRTVMYNPMRKTWKVWRDYKSIVIGKSLTTQNVSRVSKRIHKHVSGLRKVLRIIK